MLFYVGFEGDFCPLLVDGADEAHARAMAIEATIDNLEPKTVNRVVPIQVGVFVAELFAEDEDGTPVDVLPLDHTVDLLDRIDSIDAAPCGAEAEADDGEIVHCTLPPHESGDHEGVTGGGALMRWPI